MELIYVTTWRPSSQKKFNRLDFIMNGGDILMIYHIWKKKETYKKKQDHCWHSSSHVTPSVGYYESPKLEDFFRGSTQNLSTWSHFILHFSCKIYIQREGDVESNEPTTFYLYFFSVKLQKSIRNCRLNLSLKHQIIILLSQYSQHN